MGIINNAHGGNLYSMLILIYKNIKKRSTGISLEQLNNLCKPITIYKNKVSDKLELELRAWEKLGLFYEKDNKYFINDQYKTNNISKLPYLLRKVLFNYISTNKEIWVKNTGSGDFIRPLCMMLSLDIYEKPKGWTGRDIGLKISNSLTNYPINENEEPGFKMLCQYLGFIWNRDFTHFEIDPFTVIKDDLENIFVTKKEMPIKGFLASLASNIPVLDNGRFRKEIEQKMKDFSSLKEYQVSTSLSRALLRLEFDKTIKLSSKSDAINYEFIGPIYNKERKNKYYTHIRYLKGGK